VKRLIPVFIVASSFVPALAQLTPDQRAIDFQTIVGYYARNYAPAPWKAQSLGFNLFNTGSWLTRVRAAKDDLEYLGIVLEFTGSFRDTHTSVTVPSTLYVRLGFTTDLYDDKVVVDSISRASLPEATYPFGVGDEVVSVDGKSVAELIVEFSKYLQMGNDRATKRFAAATIARRYQEYSPRIVELGDTAKVEVRRAGQAATETFDIPWIKTGVGVRGFGPLPGFETSSTAEPESPRAHAPLDRIRQRVLPGHRRYGDEFLASIGAVRPGFDLPEGATVRLNSPVYSAVYEVEGFKIGFLRVQNFSFGTTTLRTIRSEIAYFQENADGLVLDITRNPGGSCQFEELAKSVIPGKWQSTGDRFRPTLELIGYWRSELSYAGLLGYTAEQVAALQGQLTMLEETYGKGELLAPAFPACEYAFEKESPETAFSKPAILLIDELSISAADFFAVTFKDNKRGLLVGKRSNGAGGAVFGDRAISFMTELQSSNTISLGTRPGTTDRYFENIGVEPDIELELMTLDNLNTKGKSYVDGFTKVIVDEIKKAKEAAPAPSSN